MRLIHTAQDAKALAKVARPLVRSPGSFDGRFVDLLEQYILPNLPTPQAVEAFHHQLAEYAARPDALYLVRAVSRTERGKIYEARNRVRFKATDNAPAWWVHAALAQDYRIAPDAFADVIATIPTHLFQVAATCAPTANEAGWHIAHIFDVGDRNTDYHNWSRPDVLGRFVRNIHPCNYVLLPKPEWQRWGADARVIGCSGAMYAERYGAVWKDFLRLSRALGGKLTRVTGDVVYSYQAMATVEQPPPEKPRRVATNPRPRDAGQPAEYRASRLSFKRDVIEPLGDNEWFRVVTPVGTFAMTKAQFYDAFPNVVRSGSYKAAGLYHYPTVPRIAEQFRIEPTVDDAPLEDETPQPSSDVTFPVPAIPAG